TWESLQDRKDRILERLAARPEVDLMLVQKENGAVLVKSARGEAEISRPNGFLHYKVNGGDPFGYGPLPEKMTDRESLALTDQTDYPDGPAQALQIFKSSRAGDVILSAAKGDDLRLRYEIHEHKSSHGSLHWEHMKIPLVTNARLKPGPVRSVDVFPT